MTTWNDDHTEDTTPLVEDESATEPEAVTVQVAEKPKRARRRNASPSGLTKPQVMSVLDTFEALTDSDDTTREVLAAVYRVENAVDELTVAISTVTKLDADPLRELLLLRGSINDDPFAVSATVAGMERGVRNRIHAVLATVSGNSAELPRDDVQAAVALTKQIQALDDSEVLHLELAQEIRGG